MNTRAILALAPVAALAANANAQENVSYDLAYGLSTLNPGDTQTITISATMAPGIGGAVIWNSHGGTGQTGTVYAFASTIFDIMNVLTGETGTFSNPVVEPRLNAANIPGAPAPSGNWNGVNAGQIVFFFPDQRNPIPLFSIKWTPVDYTARTVAFNTRLNNPQVLNQVFLSVGLTFPVGDDWTSTFGANSFNIVPAPASVLPLSLAALGAIRRRRAWTPARQAAPCPRSLA